MLHRAKGIPEMKWAIIVHGGAHTIPPEKVEPHKVGCLRAVDAGVALLEKGGSALEAVEAAIRVLEDDPTFNAGHGSMLNTDGEAEMDAAIMEGEHLDAGGVAAIQGVRHPISVARRVLDSDTVLLSGEGAERFAAEQNAELCDPGEMIHEEQLAEWRADKEKRGSDTVGCVALDAQGNFAAGTSTGGLMHKRKGRIGDSPLVGLGLYADNTAGGCALTGDGESIMRLALAHRIIESMLHGADADQAAEEAIAVMAHRVGGEAGAIVLDRQGRVGFAHNADNLAHAWRTSEMASGIASVKKGD
jgi:L-asparaginase / beta-aspartyl-peptidase